MPKKFNISLFHSFLGCLLYRLIFGDLITSFLLSAMYTARYIGGFAGDILKSKTFLSDSNSTTKTPSIHPCNLIFKKKLTIMLALNLLIFPQYKHFALSDLCFTDGMSGHG